VLTEEQQGWQPDPFGRHQSRYFSAGRPTYLVRDGHVEGADPVEQIPPQAYPLRADAGMAAATYASPPVMRAPVTASPWSVPGDARTTGRHGTPGYNGRMAVVAAVVVVLLVGLVIIAVAATRHQQPSTARPSSGSATTSNTPVASPAAAAASPAVVAGAPTVPTNSAAEPTSSPAVAAGVMVASTSGHFSARFPSAPIQQSVEETISGVHASIRVAVLRSPLTEIAEEDLSSAVPENQQALALRSAIAVAAGTAVNGSPSQQSETTFRSKAARTSTFTTSTGEQITAMAFFEDSRTVYFLLADAGAPFQSLSTSLQFDAASPPQVLS